MDHAQDIKKRLSSAGFRVEVDPGSERLGKQIRNAEQARIPVMGIIGAKVPSCWVVEGGKERWQCDEWWCIRRNLLVYTYIHDTHRAHRMVIYHCCLRRRWRVGG
jgi:hypothetical protein